MAPTWAGPGLFKCNITATLPFLESYNVYDLFQPRNLRFFILFPDCNPHLDLVALAIGGTRQMFRLFSHLERRGVV